MQTIANGRGGGEPTVRRRTLLKQLSSVAIVSTVAATTGCMGSAAKPTPKLRVVSANGEVTTFGNVIITTRVENRGDKDGSAELWAEVTLQNGRKYSTHRGIMVAAGESRTYELSIDLPFAGTLGLAASAASGDQVDMDVWLENESK